ncbi:hypothetical protein BDY19DRAFT_900609, partial [Irpex rosettiformis]
MRKGEAWLNTFSPTLTYLLRCNSDVTSLSSGTAIKSVIAYVTDYITKSPLKTHVIFDAVKTIFARNMEEPLKDDEKQKKGRSVITKIVNALTAKSEIGSPMASMYLLNHPDHYTSHVFQRFYWKPYVNEVRFVGISPVLDYVYRPRKYENICLYDWIRTFNKSKFNNIKKSNTQYAEKKEWAVEYIIQHNEQGSDSSSSLLPSSNIHQSNDNQSSKKININKIQTYEHQLTNSDYYRYDDFLPDHPQYNTHKVHIVPESKAKVPDFIGTPLPRCDRGNREEYCMTMLTFFCPWRKGRDLKSSEETWNKKFENYEFSSQHCDVMKYFNLRYECNDARDDFASQRRSQYYNENGWPTKLDTQTTEWLDKHDNSEGYTEFSNFNTENDEGGNYSISALSNLKRMIETEELIQYNGLLN